MNTPLADTIREITTEQQSEYARQPNVYMYLISTENLNTINKSLPDQSGRELTSISGVTGHAVLTSPCTEVWCRVRGLCLPCELRTQTPTLTWPSRDQHVSYCLIKGSHVLFYK